MSDSPIRIAAMGDLHCRVNFAGKFRSIFSQIDDTADVLPMSLISFARKALPGTGVYC
ncbi:MAG: hypothetical protein ACREO5_10850 [Candidatus Binatia bacterium]